MNILIIGGGIGGPALATFLARQGKRVTLIEQASAWKNIGFGVNVWGIGRKVLAELGVDAKLEPFGYPVETIDLSTPAGQKIFSLDFDTFLPYGGRQIVVPRAKLHELILEALHSSVEVLLGTTVIELQQDGKQVRVHLSDGTTRTFDLVVGADGINSKTREFVSRDDVRYYDLSVSVFWLPEGVPCPKNPTGMSRVGSALWFYPLLDRTFIATSIRISPFQKISIRDRLAPFRQYFIEHGWREEDLQKVIDSEGTHYVDDLKYVRRGPWSKGRVALLGDARHGFIPTVGMGASMALEDAKVLAEELAKVDTENIEQALVAYAQRRNPRVDRVRRFSAFTEVWCNPRSIWPAMSLWLMPRAVTRFLLQKMVLRILKQKI